MDEGRKRTILIAASVLVARKWDQFGGRPSPAMDAAITDAITLAEKIMQKIDSRAATPPAHDIKRGISVEGTEIELLRSHVGE